MNSLIAFFGITVIAHAGPTPDCVWRILPIGDPPPFRQIVQNDKRQELEAPPGTLPPRHITATSLKDAPKLTLSLGNPSTCLTVPGNTDLTLNGDNGFHLKLPSGNSSGAKLALLWREPDKSWNQPRMLVLADGPADFPIGKVRLINLLPATAAIRLDGKAIQLSPGQSEQISSPEHTCSLEISFRTSDGNWIPVHNASFEIATGQRSQVIIYRADTPGARRPAKVAMFHETVPSGTLSAPQ